MQVCDLSPLTVRWEAEIKGSGGLVGQVAWHLQQEQVLLSSQVEEKSTPGIVF